MNRSPAIGVWKKMKKKLEKVDFCTHAHMRIFGIGENERRVEDVQDVEMDGLYFPVTSTPSGAIYQTLDPPPTKSDLILFIIGIN